MMEITLEELARQIAQLRREFESLLGMVRCNIELRAEVEQRVSVIEKVIEKGKRHD